jgi:hypothetical protein
MLYDAPVSGDRSQAARPPPEHIAQALRGFTINGSEDDRMPLVAVVYAYPDGDRGVGGSCKKVNPEVITVLVSGRSLLGNLLPSGPVRRFHTSCLCLPATPPRGSLSCSISSYFC